MSILNAEKLDIGSVVLTCKLTVYLMPHTCHARQVRHACSEHLTWTGSDNKNYFLVLIRATVAMAMAIPDIPMLIPS